MNNLLKWETDRFTGKSKLYVKQEGSDEWIHYSRVTGCLNLSAKEAEEKLLQQGYKLDE